MAGAATRLPTKADRLRRNQQQIKDIYGLNRNRLSPQTIQNPAFGSAGAGGDTSSAATSNTLKTQGDTMIGPIAFFPVDVFIDSTTVPTNPSIDIGQGANNGTDYSTYVLVTGSEPAALNTIYGAAFAGQLLKLQAVVDIELFDGATAGAGNLVITGLESTIVPAGSITEFIFDITTAPNGNQGGWRLASTGNPAGEQAEALLLRLGDDQPTEGLVDWDFNFIFGNPVPIHIVDLGTGVFELIDGLFRISSKLALQMIEAGSGSVAVHSWQQSSDGVTGWINIVEPNGVVGTFATGRPEFTTQPEALAILDVRGSNIFIRNFVQTTQGSFTGGGILDNPSAGTIEFVPEGGSGGGGGGGSETLGGLTDVTITAPANDQVIVYQNGIWVNQTNPAGTLNTNLSNMTAPTIPTVDLSLNGNSLLGIFNADFDGLGGIRGLSSLDFFQANQSITSLSSGLITQVAATQEHFWAVGGASAMRVADIGSGVLAMELFNHSIDDVKDINFSGNSVIPTNIAGIGWDTPNFRIEYNTPAINIKHEFTLAGNPRLRVDFNGIEVVGAADVDALLIDPSGTPATITGQFVSDGSDVFVYSGGAARNMSDIGGGGAGNSISQGNSNVTVTDTGVGAVTIAVDAASIASFTTGLGMVLEKPLAMTGSNITGTGDITPNGQTRNLGGSTLWWTSVFADRYYFENTGNFIFGDSFGLEYEANSHDFKINGSQKIVINASEVDFLDDLNTNGNDLRMNNGDILLCDQMTFNGSGSTLTGIDFLTFHDSGGFINMLGSDILNVGDINAQSMKTTSIEIDGTLNHDGSTLGFFGTTPDTRKSYQLLSGTEILLQVIGKINELASIFGQSNYGLILTT